MHVRFAHGNTRIHTYRLLLLVLKEREREQDLFGGERDRKSSTISAGEVVRASGCVTVSSHSLTDAVVGERELNGPTPRAEPDASPQYPANPNRTTAGVAHRAASWAAGRTVGRRGPPRAGCSSSSFFFQTASDGVKGAGTTCQRVGAGSRQRHHHPTWCGTTRTSRIRCGQWQPGDSIFSWLESSVTQKILKRRPHREVVRWGTGGRGGYTNGTPSASSAIGPPPNQPSSTAPAGLQQTPLQQPLSLSPHRHGTPRGGRSTHRH